MPIGMKPILGSSGAVADLGVGLADQVKSETDDERKKRMQAMSQSQLIGPASSLAVGSIFGGPRSAGL